MIKVGHSDFDPVIRDAGFAHDFLDPDTASQRDYAARVLFHIGGEVFSRVAPHRNVGPGSAVFVGAGLQVAEFTDVVSTSRMAVLTASRSPISKTFSFARVIPV